MNRVHLHPQHLEELAVGSGIDNELVHLNFCSLSGMAVYDSLLISNQLPRTNTGRLTDTWLQRYTHVEQGGWWCSGLDPLKAWQPMEWGCFKPDVPFVNHKGKLIKYEHPPAMKTRVFCLRVSLRLWQRVAERYAVALPTAIEMAESGEALGFWQWVVKCRLPIILCEGAKKAAALLSLGYIAIALPGITSGYRSIKDEYGWVKHRQLIPDLEIFAGHPIYICFDCDAQPKTRKAVDRCIAQLGQLLETIHCSVKVIRLPGEEKGVDDLIVAKGEQAFTQVYTQANELEIDLARTRIHSELTYPPALTLNQRYLDSIPFPESGLVGIKSAKGTGKTTAIANFVQQSISQNRPVLLITHRIQLGRYLCDQIGVNWIQKTTDLTLKNQHSPLNNLGLCFDSIWRINPQDWQGAILILDEVEQSLWHLLNSSTCKQKRVKLLSIFQQIITTILQTDGLVIAQDADLSDISLDYLQSLSQTSIQPWVVINEWKPEQPWDVTFYDSPNPAPLIHQLEQDLSAGLKCYVTTDSRSGRYSIETLYEYLKDRLEKLQKQYPKTLLVSSQTTKTLGHEAIEFVENIPQQIQNYDAIFTTPSLGTGISIDIPHFDRVYGIFNGVIPDDEARQSLARVRDNVPRFIWCAKRGIGFIGSGSKNYRVLADWYQANQRENLALIRIYHQLDVDLPLVYDPIHLRTWAKFSARVNASLTFYRQGMLAGLKLEGHEVKVINNKTLKERQKELRYQFLATKTEQTTERKNLVLTIVQLTQELENTEAKTKDFYQEIDRYYQKNKLAKLTAVANSSTINSRAYQSLLRKPFLTHEEFHQEQKYLLQQRYGIEVTPELQKRDRNGYYEQLLTHYYLICDRIPKIPFVWGEQEQVFLPDLSAYPLKIEILKILGIPQLLDANRNFQETDSDLVYLKEIALRCRQHLKRALGIVIPNETISSIKIFSQLLGQLGLKLQRVKDKNSRYSEEKIYCIDRKTLEDGRQQIFAVWQELDKLDFQPESQTIAV